MSRMTKAQLIEENAKLRAHCDWLERQVAAQGTAANEVRGATPAARAARNANTWFDASYRAEYRAYLDAARAKAAAGAFVVRVMSYAQWLNARQTKEAA